MPTLHRVTTLDLIVDNWRWPFAAERRADIDAHFATQREAKPALFNGRVLLARAPRVDGETFSARYFETDFASFLAWRDWGFPDKTVFNAPGSGALRGSDGGFVMGEMAAHTSNAGKIYFPSGTPDLNDIGYGRVDLAGSVAREVAEETGLFASDFAADPIWHLVCDGQLLAMIRILDMPRAADDIRICIEANLRSQRNPELCAAHVVRNMADIHAAMPSFVAAFISAQVDRTA